jgi:hypothetical protein
MRSLVAATIVGAFVSLFAALARVGSDSARAQPQMKGASAAGSCKSYGAGKCCDPAVTSHLPKEAVFSACGESEATFLGEQAGKDTCKYVFRVEGQKPEDTIVQLYAPAQKDVPDAPSDPFFRFKKIGKVFVTDKALSPKSAPLLAASTGLWLPGAGYFVSVNASTRVCTKGEAERLARSLR